MSLLLRYIVKGLGWELGKTAAEEAVAKLRSTPETDAEREAREKAEAKAAAKAAKEAKRAAAAEAKRRAAEAKRREREVDQELKALKKRIGKP